MTGIQKPMILSEQFFTAVSADPAEIIVGIGNTPLHIGDSNNDRLIDGELHFNQFLPGRVRPRFRHADVGDVLMNLNQPASWRRLPG
jgi:hypothetical protein